MSKSLDGVAYLSSVEGAVIKVQTVGGFYDALNEIHSQAMSADIPEEITDKIAKLLDELQCDVEIWR